MAEQSLPWTTGATGDGASTFSATRTQEWLRDTFTSDRYANEGVLAGVGGQLAVSAGSGNVSVAAGAAYVYGLFYQNTAATVLTVPTSVVGTTGHRIVLRASWSAQTVRLAIKSSADGTSSPPGLTQSAGTTWEISLATVQRTTGGVITVTDARDYCHFSAAPVYRRQGGSASDWSSPGSTNYTPGGSLIQVGAASVSFSSSESSSVTTVTFPQAFSAPPVVILTGLNSGDSDKRKVVYSVETVSATAFGIRGYICDGDDETMTCTCFWEAIGPE